MSQTATHHPTIVDHSSVVRVSSLKCSDVHRSSFSSNSGKPNKSVQSAKSTSAPTSTMRPSSASCCVEVHFEDAFLRLIKNRPVQKPAGGQFGGWKKEWPVYWEGAGLGAY